MNEKMERLNDFIRTMKADYSYYKFINTMEDNSAESSIIESQYTILVKNIPIKTIGSFMTYVKENILMPCAEQDEELPTIITLPLDEICHSWQVGEAGFSCPVFSSEKLQTVKTSPPNEMQIPWQVFKKKDTYIHSPADRMPEWEYPAAA